MFFFANFILVALFVAVLGDGVTAFLRGGAPRHTLHYLWTQERLLFTSWQQDSRLRCGPLLYYFALAAYLIEVTLLNTQMMELLPTFVEGANVALDQLVCICLGAKILLCTRYNWRQLSCAFCCYFILRWIYFNSQNIWFISAIFFILAVKDMCLNRVAFHYCIFGGFGTGVTMLLSVLGLFGYHTQYPTYDRVRYCFGFTHPNTLGGVLLGLLAAWLLYRGARVGWKDWLGTGCILYILFISSSRSALLGGLLLLAASIFVRLGGALLTKKPFQLFLASVPGWIAFLSFLLPRLLIVHDYNDYDPPIMAKLDGLLTGRIYQSWRALKLITPRIAGRMSPESFIVIDNSYVSTWLLLGPVAFAMIWGGCAVMIYRLLRKGCHTDALVTICMSIYAFAEILYFHLTTNPTLLLYGGLMFAASAGEFPSFRKVDG